MIQDTRLCMGKQAPSCHFTWFPRYRGEVLRLVATAYHEPDALWIKERCLRFGINLEVEVRDQAEFATRDGLPEHDCQLFGNVFSNDEISELEMYIQKNYFLPAFDEPLAKEISKVRCPL
ncbi:hypothetical protein [Brevibacillus reuszeri]|uniref:hypothetical protein n=1 Tax=Brevibacillus reuszeri TaxID=54915 RepID=UPI003D255D7C